MLTREEISILLELREFSLKKNLVGETYQIVGVPNSVFQKLIIGLGLGKETPMPLEPTAAGGPVPFVEKRSGQLIAEYQSKNPTTKVTGQVRLQAEHTALLEYLQWCHRRGKL